MSTSSLLTLLLGAVLATLGGMFTELWRQRRDRRVAARLIYLELLRNYGVIVSFRVGDAGRSTLGQLSSITWKEQSSKFALLQSYTDFQGLWGLYQMFPILNGSEDGQLTPAAIDAVLNTLDDALMKVGSLAGIRSSSLEEMKEANQRIRRTADLTKEQRIVAWQAFYADSDYRRGKRLADPQGFSINESGDVVLALAHTLALSVSEDRIELTLPSPTYSNQSLAAGVALADRLLIQAGQPLVTRISSRDIDDPAVKRLLAELGNSALFLVALTYSFLPESDFKSVDIAVNLQNEEASASPLPIVRSMNPTRLDSNVTNTSRISLSVASHELSSDFTKNDASAFLLAAGEGTSHPIWHLKSTTTAEIRGVMRFTLLVEVAKDASAKATVTVRASRKSRLKLVTLQSQPTTFEFPS